MKGYNKLHIRSSKMIAVLIGFLLFSCNNEDFLNSDPNGMDENQICFGIKNDQTSMTRSNGPKAMDANEALDENFVLRSEDSSDTLCMHATISDYINTTPIDNRKATRANPIASLEKYTSFQVQAQCKKNDVLISSFYIDDVVKQKNATIWSTVQKYYWPEANYTLKFYAWSPIINAITGPTTPESTILSYTVPETVADQPDIVVAKTAEMDPTTSSNKAVPLTFNHICTQICFLVGENMQEGQITSITLKNIFSSGNYDMESETWSNLDTKKDFKLGPITMSGTEKENDSITSGNNIFMMLPQTFADNSDAQVEVIFNDEKTEETRTLTAPLTGSWPMGKKVIYKLSITPEYTLKFISVPKLVDAHYVIDSLEIKAGKIPGGWTLKSNSEKVTLRTDLTDLEKEGYWIEEDRGAQEITSSKTGEIMIYTFIAENDSDATRDVTLSLYPTEKETYVKNDTLSQLCPAWNGTLGCERIEEGDYPWGFKWDKNLKITYDMTSMNIIKRIIFTIYIDLFEPYKYITVKRNFLGGITKVIVNFNDIDELNVANDNLDGEKNTWELYNFNGVSSITSIMNHLKNWGGIPDKELSLNPAEYAAKACAMKNKFSKEVETEGLETVEIPKLEEKNMVWYLPAKEEAPSMTDSDYPLGGEYWTSTTKEEDNENAYKYSVVGDTTSLESRTTLLHVRAVRKK